MYYLFVKLNNFNLFCEPLKNYRLFIITACAYNNVGGAPEYHYIYILFTLLCLRALSKSPPCFIFISGIRSIDGSGFVASKQQFIVHRWRLTRILEQGPIPQHGRFGLVIDILEM